MVQLVDSLDLATNVEFLDGLVQVLDGRVLWVTAKDKLSLSGPKSGEIPRQQAPLKHEPLRLFYCKRVRCLRHQTPQNLFFSPGKEKETKRSDA